VVCLPGPGRPRGLLPRENNGQLIEVCNIIATDGFVDCKQAGLMGEELPNGDALLPLLRELRPVRAHALLVIEQAA
jgi:hypothetical protein